MIFHCLDLDGAETRRIGDRGARHAGEDDRPDEDRKSTRLNSSHLGISYAVFCLKKKNKLHTPNMHDNLNRPTTINQKSGSGRDAIAEQLLDYHYNLPYRIKTLTISTNTTAIKY